MSKQSSIFEQTYQNYVNQIAAMDLDAVKKTLGARLDENGLTIDFYGQAFRVSPHGIMNASGNRPPLDICVILCQYIFHCPAFPPMPSDWVSFRDFKDSGPLTVYWRNDVEQPIAMTFSKRRDRLEQAGRAMGGDPPATALPYDLALQFTALPRIPVIMLFNDADSEFPAQASVLFQKSAETYLDAESLAMLGRTLAVKLIQY